MIYISILTEDGTEKKKWYDHIQLCFNDKFDTDRNNQILNELLEILSNLELKNVVCHVQYNTKTDNEKLYTDVAKRYKDLEEKFVSLRECVEKVREVGEYNGKKQYGFKKRCKKILHVII